jgi:hypothetical protein
VQHKRFAIAVGGNSGGKENSGKFYLTAYDTIEQQQYELTSLESTSGKGPQNALVYPNVVVASNQILIWSGISHARWSVVEPTDSFAFGAIYDRIHVLKLQFDDLIKMKRDILSWPSTFVPPTGGEVTFSELDSDPPNDKSLPTWFLPLLVTLLVLIVLVLITLLIVVRRAKVLHSLSPSKGKANDEARSFESTSSSMSVLIPHLARCSHVESEKISVSQHNQSDSYYQNDFSGGKFPSNCHDSQEYPSNSKHEVLPVPSPVELAPIPRLPSPTIDVSSPMFLSTSAVIAYTTPPTEQRNQCEPKEIKTHAKLNHERFSSLPSIWESFQVYETSPLGASGLRRRASDSSYLPSELSVLSQDVQISDSPGVLTTIQRRMDERSPYANAGVASRVSPLHVKRSESMSHLRQNRETPPWLTWERGQNDLTNMVFPISKITMPARENLPPPFTMDPKPVAPIPEIPHYLPSWSPISFFDSNSSFPGIVTLELKDTVVNTSEHSRERNRKSTSSFNVISVNAVGDVSNGLASEVGMKDLTESHRKRNKSGHYSNHSSKLPSNSSRGISKNPLPATIVPKPFTSIPSPLAFDPNLQVPKDPFCHKQKFIKRHEYSGQMMNQTKTISQGYGSDEISECNLFAKGEVGNSESAEPCTRSNMEYLARSVKIISHDKSPSGFVDHGLFKRKAEGRVEVPKNETSKIKSSKSGHPKSKKSKKSAIATGPRKIAVSPSSGRGNQSKYISSKAELSKFHSPPESPGDDHNSLYLG